MLIGCVSRSVSCRTIPAAELDCCWAQNSPHGTIPEPAAIKCAQCIPTYERRDAMTPEQRKEEDAQEAEQKATRAAQKLERLRSREGEQ